MAFLNGTINKHRPPLAPYEDLYRHFHANPELSTQESETANRIKQHLSSLSPNLDIRPHIGGHGLVAIFKNGPGKIILLRADIDALPLAEKTGLPYASTKTMTDTDGITKPTMHACGHDFHITSLLAAADLLLSARNSWSGTLIFLFQPAEERGSGARAMVDDGLYDPQRHNVPVPDIVLGQHVMPERAGDTGTRVGAFMSAADSFRVTVFGRGGHGSQPHRCVDPVVIASSIVLKLQTIVSREVAPGEVAVVTVGAIQAGHTENIISDEATLKVDIRSVSPRRREKILASVRRIVSAECVAGNSPRDPVWESTRSFPLTVNDEDVTKAVNEAFIAYFGPESHQPRMESVLGSEDFSVLASAVERPYCFWTFGGVEAERWDRLRREGKLETDVPVNHSPFFAPVVQPTLKTGVDAMSLAALTFLDRR